MALCSQRKEFTEETVGYPTVSSVQAKAQGVVRFLEETIPGLRVQARRAGPVVFFVDEAVAPSDPHCGTTWGKIRQTPVVRESGDRFGLRPISAESSRGDMKFASFEG